MFLVAIWFLNIRVLNITYGLKQPEAGEQS